MSKIRNLFDKIFKKNKSSQDLDEIFDDQDYYDEVTNIQELPDDFDDEYEDENVPVFSSTEESDQELDDNFVEDHVPEFEEEELDQEVPQFDNIQDDEQDFENEEYEDDVDYDFEKEGVFAQNSSDDFTATDLHGDYTATSNAELDLTNTDLSFKEKLDQLGIRVKDKFRSFRTKDLNQAYKKPDSSSSASDSKLESLKSKVAQFNWSNLPSEFFNKSRRAQIHKYFQIAMALTILIILTTGISNLISGKKDYNSMGSSESLNINTSSEFSKDDLEQIKMANVFKTDQRIENTPKKTVNTQQLCKEAKKKSSVQVKLVNTIVLQDSVKSIASVQVRSERTLKEIREGERLLGKIKIDKIERLRLIVKNLSTGECESIENDKFDKAQSRSPKIAVKSPSESKAIKAQLKKIKGIETDGNNFKIEKSFLKDKLSDINSILTQARGIPLRNPDGSYSFKIVDIEAGGVFSYLGVQDGDIISEINGEPIKDMNEVMNLFANVSNLPKLNLTIKRGGETVTQNYNIE